MATIIDVPCGVGLTSPRFDPVRPQNVARMEGRFTERDVFATAYWVADYVSPTTRLAHIGELDAFFMAIEDGAFARCFDMTRPRPLEYLKGALSGVRAGGGAFDGTATLSAIVNSRTLTITGLPANWQLRAGDYLEVRQSPTVLSLHRVAADAKASAGGLVSVQIRFALDLQNFTTAAIVNFEKPSFLGQIDPGSYQAARRRGDRGVSFSVQEVFPG